MKFLLLVYALLNYFLWSLGGLTWGVTAAEGVELVELMAELQTLPWGQDLFLHFVPVVTE